MSLKRIVPVVAARIALFAAVLPISASVEVSTPAGRPPAPKGIESGDIDRTADPCTDFYAFANGAWRSSNPIPAGAKRWSRRWAAREENRRQLTSLLEVLASMPDRRAGSIEQQLGDHFASCMNEPAIDAAGATPIAPMLAEIAAVEDAAGVQRMIRRLHELAIPAPFAVSAASDYRDPAAFVANIAAGGLGLPDRDYYLKPDSQFIQAREKYRAHVAAVLALGGLAAAPARNAAEEILSLETRLAEASLAPAEAGDPAATAHKMTFAELAKLSPRIDWMKYFAEAGLPRIDVNVAEPAYLERVNRELGSTPVAVWKNYLAWHVLESASPWLSKPLADQSFAFKEKYLGGAAEEKPRAMRCLESTETLLGESLGRKYAERYFPPAAKAKVQEITRDLLAVLEEDIREIDWMSEATKREALAKIKGYDVLVGYPDAWTDMSSLAIRRDAFWENVAAARRFGVELDRKRVGRRTSRSTWQLPPSSPDAYIDIQLNLMALPAGFLQPPVFDLAASDAVNYGAIGIGVAHDLTHAIDALGADFDSSWQPRKWWAEADLRKFQETGRCTVEQYDGYEIEPGVRLQGKQVLGEALGDLAGVRLAYRALEKSMQRRRVPVIDGLSPAQQFFVAWCQFRGAAESPELQREMAKGDPHPAAKFRVIGPLSNSPDFQKAFGCKPGSAMVRPPEKRCGVW